LCTPSIKGDKQNTFRKKKKKNMTKLKTTHSCATTKGDHTNDRTENTKIIIIETKTSMQSTASDGGVVNLYTTEIVGNVHRDSE
jgi:hypothetical protein